jgi:L-alanine-DL-glutamate epimerase-like enolase superfamily enzyme
MQNGTMAVPYAPGLGVEVDIDFVQHLTVRTELLATSRSA